MKGKINQQMAWRYGRFFAFLVMVAVVFTYAATALPSGLRPDPQAKKAEPANPVVENFLKRAKEYVKLRERIEGKMPKLSQEATPQQIEAHQEAFTKLVREARVGAKRGDLFSADVATVIRQIIRREFKGQDRRELKETVLEADTKGVPLRVNYPYPETKELTQIPPTLLLELPQLPKQLRYRFVGKHMLLVDRENNLILDYMLNALP